MCLKSFAILHICMSANDCKSTRNIDSGVTHTFYGVDEFANMEAVSNEDGLYVKNTDLHFCVYHFYSS